MTACSLCPHYSSEHDEPKLGGRCRVRYYELRGFGDNTITVGRDYLLCECPGYEPDQDEPDDA